MKKINKLLALFICVAMLIPMMSFAGAYGVTQNPDINMPHSTPMIDGEIEETGVWSEAAYHNDDTAGYFWEHNAMTSDARLYFAYNSNNLYFAADIEDNDANSGMIASTGYDTDKYGFNGDVITLMLDPLGIFEKSDYQTTPWYNIGIFEDGSIGVYRTQVNDEDITDSVNAKGAITDKGWRFEVSIPWSVIADDTNAITNDALTYDYIKFYEEGSVTRASVMYLDRSSTTKTWGRFITVCENTYDGYAGTDTSGVNAKSYGLILKNGGTPHNWNAWIVIKEASCTEAGSRERTCNDCDMVETESIAALEHSFDEWETVKEAQGGTDGLKQRVCSVCGETESKTIPAGGNQLIVAYFNASVGISSYEFENIDVINYHPATINVNAASNPDLASIITHNYTGRYENFRNIATQQNPDIKFLFTVANNNLQVFESWFYNRTYASKLAQAMTIIIETYGFDGLDIDYEFPTGAQNLKDNFVYFMQCMRENLDNLSAHNGKEYYLSMAVPGTQWTFNLFDMPALAQYVDYFNMMNYDLYIQHNVTHHHTPAFDNDASTGFVGGSVYSDIQLYLERGIPADKIVAGCGMYALRYKGVENVNNGLYQPGTRDGTNLHYTDLLGGYINKNGFVRYWDPVAQAPYLYNASTKTFISYDDEQSVEAKCKIVAQEGVRGIMVFDYCTTDGIGLFDNMRAWLDSYTPATETDVLDVYTDINKEQWYAEGVRYCVNKGYMAGTSSTAFTPNGNLTREQFVTILARVADAELDEYYNTESVFSDIKIKTSTEWYYPSVAWAYEKGYVNGIGDNKFGVRKNITREEIAALFYRYAESNGKGTDLKADLAEFTDNANISSWAKNSCAWAVNAGLIGSTSTKEKLLAPKMTVTRAQAAKIFMSYDNIQ